MAGGMSGYDAAMLNDTEESLIKGYQAAYQAAQAKGDKAGMQSAHDAAEAVRKNYGYSGGVDGSSFISLITGILPGNNGGGNSPGVGMEIPLIGGNSGNSVNPGANGTDVTLGTGIFSNLPDALTGAGLSSLSGVSAAPESTDIPKGLKTILFIFGGIVGLGFVVNMFKGGKR